ncbi:MAG: metal ABC transporter ATP-binding protein [Anaerolineales bacterium]|nr:metal ABC transporter ATP-binding protein [Anaerolineales bacterium]
MTLLDEFRKTNYLIRHRHPHEAGAPILRASGLTVRYESGFALEDISFELKVRERLAVVGPNGAGKGTLFKVIAGVLTPTSGQVHVYGHDPEGHICIAYVPQRSQVDWNFPVSVADVVMMGRIGKLKLFRQPRAQDWDIVNHSLEVVGMGDFSKRQISELSGGQQQRMFIARAFAQEAELMLMDEPLTGLDINSQEAIFHILDELKNRDVTVLVALHDLKMAAERFDRVMLLNHRLLGFGPPDEVFTPDSLVSAYGGHLHMVPTDDGTLALGDTCCDEGVHIHD